MSGSRRAAWSVVAGGLSVATLPVAVLATRYSDSYDLLHAGFAIPLAVALGITAIVLARRARAQVQATLGRAGGTKSARVGRFLGIAGLCVAASATIALSVYGLLLAVD